MSWLVYILECADGSLYTGITNDLDKRISAHNDGSGAKYTAARRPVKVVYQEACEGRSEASRREYEIKSLPRAEKLKLFT